MARLRKHLPPEILENVLARLPVYVLCRFRLVCNTWNHLITQPGFASLRSQMPPQAPAILITSKVLRLNSASDRDRKNWKILDMVEKHFYTLNDNVFDCRGWRNYTVAADGELVYVVCECQLGVQRHFVCNPMTKESHCIAEPDIHFSYDCDIVVMTVDKATQSYKIISIKTYTGNRSRQEEVYLYDSTTTKWRNVCEVPIAFRVRAISSILLKGVFYTLVFDLHMAPWYPSLYSCDLETHAWSYIGVDLPDPSHPQDKSQLVVSLDRLFFVEYTGLPSCFPSTSWETLCIGTHNKIKRKHLIKVTIWEILLTEKEVKKVAEMPKYSKYPMKMLKRPQNVMGDPVVALGCGNSVVILSSLGRNVGWDLLENCWHELQRNTEHLCGDDRLGIFASLVDF